MHVITAEDAAALTGLIYEAAFDESLWVPVMNRMADAVGGGATALIRKNLATGQGRGVFGRIEAAQFTDYFGRFALANPLADAIAPLDAGAFLIDWQVIQKPHLMRSAYYNDFLLRRDIHGVLGLMVWRQGDEAAIINLTRPPAKGEFLPEHAHLLSPFMPHLRRAIGLAEQWPAPNRHADGLEAVLAVARAAVLVLDGGGRILYANVAAERILAAQDGFRIAHGVLSAANPAAAQRLGAQLRTAAHAGAGSVAVPRPSGMRPYAVEIMPCRPESIGLFPSPARVVVTIAELDAQYGPRRDTLQALFGLTPAQTSVASLLARGRELRDIAVLLGVSRFTVRRHLADVMAKTETNSQVALVQLLSRLSQAEALTGAHSARH
ncbi:MAG TPA: helix-turn-helix transcriptional regulator [Acetobacteraceae bacterium]|jgi:DNA-binding CsgD family transcriptional regulator